MTLNRQVTRDLISCTVNLGCTNTLVGLTTDAIDIRFRNASVFGDLISGDIAIGQSFAGRYDPNIAVPEPASLLLLVAGVTGLARVRARRSRARG